MTTTFAAGSAIQSSLSPIRIIVMPYKLTGDIGNTKLDKEEHQPRLECTNLSLRTGLQQTDGYDLANEAASEAFTKKATTALGKNACNGCEAALAKELNAKQTVVPWVYKLSQLVLTMHFVILDSDPCKTLLKKSLDFNGGNDQS